MRKSTFLALNLMGGIAAIVFFGMADRTGFLLPRFGSSGPLDASSRQGYWYTYKPSESSSSRSPGGRGGYSSGGGGGGGGWGGGK